MVLDRSTTDQGENVNLSIGKSKILRTYLQLSNPGKSSSKSETHKSYPRKIPSLQVVGNIQSRVVNHPSVQPTGINKNSN